MRKLQIVAPACLLACLLGGPVFGQASAPAPTPAPIPIPNVTITAKGHEVRDVLGSLFQQAKKSYVLAPNLRTSLYLTLADTPFDKALAIVCDQAKLSVQIRDGVYFVEPAKAVSKPVASKPEAPKPELNKPVPATKKFTPPLVKAAVTAVVPVPTATLVKRVRTNLIKNDLRTVIAEFARQTGTVIEVEPNVPAYKLDAVLLGTSLKFALDEVSRATNLTYVYTERKTILLRKK